jgi:hypothetical protein
VTQALSFAHRPNKDGSFDSICRICCQTIGNRATETELEQDEKNHICEQGPFRLQVTYPLHAETEDSGIC